MEFIHKTVVNGVSTEEIRHYFSVKDSDEFCGTHHYLPNPIGRFADDGFGNPIARYELP